MCILAENHTLVWVLYMRVTKYTGKNLILSFICFVDLYHIIFNFLNLFFFILFSILIAFSVSKWASKHATKYTNTFHKMFHIIFFHHVSFFPSCLVISRSIRLFLSAFFFIPLISPSLSILSFYVFLLRQFFP